MSNMSYGAGNGAPPPEYVRLLDQLRSPHEKGNPNGTAYVSGYCHVLAVALQKEGGGDLVMLTPYGEPESPGHFAVHRDGIITDAYGHFTVNDWVAGWRKRLPTFDFEAHHVSRPLLDELVSVWDNPRSVDKTGIEAARPLARALIATSDLPREIWRVDPSTVVIPIDRMWPEAGLAWHAVQSREPLPASPVAVIHPEPTRDEMNGARLPHDERVVDARGRLTRIDRSMPTRDPRPTVDELFRYDDVRKRQAEMHPCGRPSECAFTAGRCHIMAVAIQENMGGDIIVLTPKDDPTYLVHAAVLKDDVVSDANGHRQSGAWGETWKARAQDPDLVARIVGRTELQAMMADTDRPLDEASIVHARPLAMAIARTSDLPHDVWRARAAGQNIAGIGSEPKLRPAEAWHSTIGLPPLPIMPSLELTGRKKSPASATPHLAALYARSTMMGR